MIRERDLVCGSLLDVQRPAEHTGRLGGTPGLRDIRRIGIHRQHEVFALASQCHGLRPSPQLGIQATPLPIGSENAGETSVRAAKMKQPILFILFSLGWPP